MSNLPLIVSIAIIVPIAFRGFSAYTMTDLIVRSFALIIRLLTSDQSRFISRSNECVWECQLISTAMRGCAFMASGCRLLQMFHMLSFVSFALVNDVFC